MKKAATTDLGAKTILLIGSGRLARHLQHWNSLLQIKNNLLTWNRSENPNLLPSLIQQCGLIWLAISDSAIVPFFEKHLISTSVITVHFSGALSDPRIKGAHPLMSFPETYLADSVYNKIGIATSGNEDLSQLLPNFRNKSFTIPDSEKSLYHALCVVSGNFPQMLWAEVGKQFQQQNVPTEFFEIYLSQILNNFLILKEKSLTGPLVRKDKMTMQKNEMALSGTKLQSIYHSFRKEFSL